MPGRVGSGRCRLSEGREMTEHYDLLLISNVGRNEIHRFGPDHWVAAGPGLGFLSQSSRQ